MGGKGVLFLKILKKYNIFLFKGETHRKKWKRKEICFKLMGFLAFWQEEPRKNKKKRFFYY